MTDLMNKLYANGYKENFVAKEFGLEAPNAKKMYKPADVKIANFYRFEGESDPADNTIMYKIETADGAKGTLIDAYGPYADEVVNKFMAEVDFMNKRNANKDKANYH